MSVALRRARLLGHPLLRHVTGGASSGFSVSSRIKKNVSPTSNVATLVASTATTTTTTAAPGFGLGFATRVDTTARALARHRGSCCGGVIIPPGISASVGRGSCGGASNVPLVVVHHVSSITSPPTTASNLAAMRSIMSSSSSSSFHAEDATSTAKTSSTTSSTATAPPASASSTPVDNTGRSTGDGSDGGGDAGASEHLFFARWVGRLLGSLLGLLFWYFVVPAAVPRRQAKSLRDEAMAELDRVLGTQGGDDSRDVEACLELFDRAIAKYEEALAVDPKSDVTLLDVVTCCFKCIEATTLIARSNNTSTSASESYMKKAKSLCEAKLAQDPEDILAMALLGTVMQMEAVEAALTPHDCCPENFKRGEETAKAAKEKFDTALRLAGVTDTMTDKSGWMMSDWTAAIVGLVLGLSRTMGVYYAREGLRRHDELEGALLSQLFVDPRMRKNTNNLDGPEGIALREQVDEARLVYVTHADVVHSAPDTRVLSASLEKLEGAAATCEAALTRDAENGGAIEVLAKIRALQATDLHAQRDLKHTATYVRKGMDACRAVLKRNPKHADALLGLGSMFGAEGVLLLQSGGQLHGDPEEERAAACFTKATSKFQEVFVLYPGDEYVHAQMLQSFELLLANITAATLKCFRARWNAIMAGCLDDAATKYEEALKVCEESGTARLYRNRSEIFDCCWRGIALESLGQKCEEGYERKMQYFERAEKALEVAVGAAAKKRPPPAGAAANTHEKCTLTNLKMLCSTHYQMAWMEARRAEERQQSGYYRQAHTAWTSAAKHFQRLLECEEMMPLSEGVTSIFEDGRASGRRGITNNIEACLKNAENLKARFDAS